MSERVTTLSIRTPEGVLFSQLLAGPLTRFLAWLIDFACLSTVLYVAQLLISLFAMLSPALAKAIGVLLFFSFSIGYPMVLEWFWRGQTLGKRILRLRVVDADGLHLKPGQIVVRNVLRFIDMLPAFYLVGGLSVFLSRKAQRLGDLAANTVVIRLPRISEPNLAPMLSDKYNSLRSHPHLEGRLRQRVTPVEAAIALQALNRRRTLDDNARVELFREIADHFKSKVAFPEEIVRDIADEQYVQNVVDIIYRPRHASRNTATTATA